MHGPTWIYIALGCIEFSWHREAFVIFLSKGETCVEEPRLAFFTDTLSAVSMNRERILTKNQGQGMSKHCNW